MADQNKAELDGKFYSEILRFVVDYVDFLRSLFLGRN